jgi:nitroreductase
VSETARAPDDAPDQVAAYKTVLRDVLDRRPSGTRQRLAAALGTNRSFITQITNPAYDVPIPAQHISTILDVCHLAPIERASFLAAYARAHPRRVLQPVVADRLRVLVLTLPDLGQAANRAVDARLEAEAAAAVREQKEAEA